MVKLRNLTLCAAALFTSHANACGFLDFACKAGTIAVKMTDYDKQVAAKKLGEAQQKAKDEQKRLEDKKKDLNMRKDELASDLQVLKDMKKKTPDEQAALAKLEDTANLVLTNRQRQMSITNTISRLFRSSDKQIQMMSKLLELAVASSPRVDDKNSLRVITDTLTAKIKSLNELAADTGETIDQYLPELMDSASSDTLVMFVNEVTIVSAYIKDLMNKIDHQIANLEAKSATLDAQLAALK